MRWHQRMTLNQPFCMNDAPLLHHARSPGEGIGMKTPRLAVACALALLSLTVRLEAAVWIKGVDVSSLKKSEDLGGVYKTTDNVPGDALAILKANGVNTIRLRVWVNPADGYNNHATTLAMAARAKALGLGVLVDFHYSDVWADPGHQTKPAAWSGYNLAQLKTAVYNATHSLCTALVAQGTPPEYVQVGNEINDGMLWPEGRLTTNGGNFTNLGQLLKEGIAAVRAASPQTAVILHIAEGGTWTTVRSWFNKAVAQGVTWDYTGLSYYPYWHGSLSAFQTTINNAATTYSKPVVVCETAYPFTLGFADSQPNLVGSSSLIPGYPATEAGQRAMIKAIMNILNAVPNGRGAGLFYWEGTWTPVTGNGWDNTNPASGNSWENQALFDFTGKALTSMSLFADYPAFPTSAFTALELTNQAVSGDAADPDGDGISNLVELAFGTNPRSPTLSLPGLPAPAVQSASGSSHLTVGFRRPVPAIGLSYDVQTADSLAGPWTSNAVQVGLPVANGDGTETVTYRDPLSGQTRRFMRVSVTRSP